MSEKLNFYQQLEVLNVDLIQFRNFYNNNKEYLNKIQNISSYKKWIDENEDLLTEFNFLSTEIYSKASNLSELILNILNNSKEQFLINISYNVNNQKLIIEKNSEILFRNFEKTNGLLSSIKENIEHGLNTGSISNTTIIGNSIKNYLTEINLYFKDSLKILDELTIVFHNLNSTLNNFYEQIRNESDKNFKEKFNKESTIIISEFESKVEGIIEDFELKRKELKASYTRTMIENKKILNNLAETEEKNNELNKKLEDYENIIKDIATNANIEIKKNLKELTDSLNLEFEKEFNLMISEFDKAKKVKDDFLTLVQNAGIYNLTENYSKKADEEKIEYKDYRKYTTWAILAAVIFTVAVFSFAIYENSGTNSSPDYLILISRLSISAMFFILALYLSKQASKHYECYQENHRTFLQLAALEPFMADMSEDEQKEIRKGLIPSYFNQGPDGKFATKRDEIGLPETFTSSIEKLIDAVKEIKISQNSNKSDGN